MISETSHTEQDVPQALVRALFRYPRTLQLALDDAGLAPHDLAMWARQSGEASDIEKLAGWLSVGQRPGHYKPLLEVAGSHLRAGDLLEALPVFRWAYCLWQAPPDQRPPNRYDGAKLLALWGECFYRLQQPDQAQKRWSWALAVVPDAGTLNRLARTIERVGATKEYEAVLAEALRHKLPGAKALWQRWQRIKAAQDQAPSFDRACPERSRRAHDESCDEACPERSRRAHDEPCDGTHDGPPDARPDAPGVVVMADVANLDMVCRDQYGMRQRLDYGRLLGTAGRHGPVRVKLAFVPDIPETLEVRRHLRQASFEIDLKRPKRSHGRVVANADTAMAAAAVRWASDPQVGRVELWTGDGDFLKVREVIGRAWPDVRVAFRSFEVGTAGAIQQLGEDWHAIGSQYLREEMERDVFAGL